MKKRLQKSCEIFSLTEPTVNCYAKIRLKMFAKKERINTNNMFFLTRESQICQNLQWRGLRMESSVTCRHRKSAKFSFLNCPIAISLQNCKAGNNIYSKHSQIWDFTILLYTVHITYMLILYLTILNNYIYCQKMDPILDAKCNKTKFSILFY
jgi:hypothetical protein